MNQSLVIKTGDFLLIIQDQVLLQGKSFYRS